LLQDGNFISLAQEIVGKAGLKVAAEQLVQSWRPQIGVDQQSAAAALLHQYLREVRRQKAFAFLGQGTGN